MSAKETFERPLWKRVGYYVVWISSRVFFAITSQLRIRGASKMPRHGGMLVCSNHQSHFDPVLVGISFRRRMNYLARKSLFDVPVLSW
ncbi:MAG: 1-acyl-sn-glycerol-3-phosphate acyltransferase, partial [Planctomycetota bacterium]|nr:1-acyl-sn-glycerol-3-phosphate acyltransferase [Planctomycetota bacterium]